MSIAAALSISQLTEDQAVEELARILDLAPDEADQLAFVHWKQEFSRRAQQLEQHIVHLQKVAAGDVPPGPEAETQDAPPHHLQPEPEPVPAATKEKPVSLRKTDDEKLASTLAYYQGFLARVKVRPGDRTLRNDCQKAACAVRTAARKAHHPEPVLEPLPPIPDPRPKGGTRPGDGVGMPKPKPAPIPTAPEPSQADVYPHHAAPLPEKAGPGPYKELTTEDLRALLPDQPIPTPVRARELAEEICRVVQTANRNNAALDSQGNEIPPVPVAPTSALREIRKAFWALLRDMEDMTYPERATLSHDLVFIQHQAAHALDLIEETEIPEAG